MEGPLGRDDPLAPALSGVRSATTPKAVRLRRRTAATTADSAFARTGGTLVVWTPRHRRQRPQALVMGDDVVVATLRRGEPPDNGRAIARWSDGSAAANERSIGAGCIRSLSVGIPPAGDLPLRPDFQRVVRGVMAPCSEAASMALGDSAATARLAGTGGAATASALLERDRGTSRLVPWLLGLALACALTRAGVRRRAPRPTREVA